MSASERICELLLRWEEARRQGREPTPEELCADCPGADSPEVVNELRQRIAAIRSMERRLGMASPGVAPTIDASALAAAAGQGGWPQSAPTLDLNHPANEIPRPPVSIPGYEILEIIDQGGMGIVYRAVQTSLQRTVAIKMIAAPRASPKHSARFQAEAEAVARLQHPHVVQIFEIGQADGRPYFTMEYMAGGTLAAWMARERPTPRRAAEIAETLARATHAAHERGIVHRDLKPGNVMLAADGTLKIADFGLAKRMDDTPDLTRSGEVLGTPGYMAPEQAAGDRERIGPATDVYAVGAILYELLARRPPFIGDNPLEVLRQVTDDDPVPPTRLRAAVPRDLEAICLKCLEKSPARRYASAQELADDLRRFLDGRPIVARRAGLARRLLKYARRHPGRASLAGLVLLVALVPAWAEVQHLRAEQRLRRRAEELAPQAYEILRQNCYECHGQNPAKIAKKLNVLDHSLLLDSDRRIVVPGKPQDSRLIQRIADGSMPLEEEEKRLPRLTEEQLTVLNDWILGGAPEPPESASPAAAADDPPTSALAEQVKRIFIERCYECHKYDVGKGGIKILHHRLLVYVRKVVVPGKPDESELFQLITTDDAERRMPPPSYEGQSHDRLPPAEIETIRQWILEGAPPFPKGE
jgi:hypothetical protein